MMTLKEIFILPFVIILLSSPVSADSMTADVQRMLNKLGYNAGTIDGAYGKKTEGALIEFYLDNGSDYDGELGSNEAADLIAAMTKSGFTAEHRLGAKDNPRYFFSTKDTIFKKVGNRIDASKNSIMTGDFNNDGQQELIGFKKSNIYSEYVSTKNRTEKHNDVDYWLTGSKLSQDQAWQSTIIWKMGSKWDNTFFENWKVSNTIEDSCVHPMYVLPAHLNEDKFIDFVVPCTGYDAAPFPGEHSLVILSNGSSSYLTKKFTKTAEFYHDAATADFNKDGKLDILLTDPFNSKMQVYLNLGNGNFKRSKKYFSQAEKYEAFSTEVLDVNDDGHFDVFMAGHEDTAPYHTSTILLGNQSNKFSNSRSLKIPNIEGYGVVLDIIKEGEHLFVLRTGSKKNFYKGSVIQQVAIKSMKNIALLEVKDMYYLDRIFRSVGKDGQIVFGSLIPHNNDIDFVLENGVMKLMNSYLTETTEPIDSSTSIVEICDAALNKQGTDWDATKGPWVREALQRNYNIDFCNVYRPAFICSKALNGDYWSHTNSAWVKKAKSLGYDRKTCKSLIE